MIRLGTLFSGIGSIEQALKRLNIEHEIVFACDNGEIEININEQDIKKQVFSLKSKHKKKSFVDNLYRLNSRHTNFVKQTYLANYDVSPSDFHLDIRFMDASDYMGKVDLLVGGSPCQSFSTVGAMGGLDDTRGTLFYEYARIISECQPKAFIFENVRGLTTHDNGKTWDLIHNVFNSLGYKITDPRILNSSDFGIPQTRRRLFVIGIKETINCTNFEFPIPLGIENLKYTMQDFLEENCAYGHFTYDKSTGELIVSKVKGNPNPKFILTPKVRDYVLSSGTKNFKTSTKTDLPIARTLLKTMTQHHRAGVDNYITVGHDETGPILRQLTDREALRLMGYPDDFKIVVSPRQMLRQAGNSIVVDVMMSLVKQLIKTNVFN